MLIEPALTTEACEENGFPSKNNPEPAHPQVHAHQWASIASLCPALGESMGQGSQETSTVLQRCP